MSTSVSLRNSTIASLVFVRTHMVVFIVIVQRDSVVMQKKVDIAKVMHRSLKVIVKETSKLRKLNLTGSVGLTQLNPIIIFNNNDTNVGGTRRLARSI